MSTHGDEPIEFDFFDEPETAEATQRRRLPRLDRSGGRGGGDGGERPPRAPLRTPTGFVPLARLVGLIAIAIVLVVGLVFWIGSCQGKSKHDEYQSYVDKVKTVAKASEGRGVKFANKLVSPGLKQSDLVTTLEQFAQQEQQAYVQSQEIRPPGPLRALHLNLVDAIELRAKALTGLADALARAGGSKAQADTAAELTTQGQLLTSSDVVWEQLYRLPATARLKEKGVTGVVIPGSTFVKNPDIVSARSFTLLMARLSGTASTGGTPSGKHGNGIVSVKVLPQGDVLSAGSATTIKVSADLAFTVTVENSGDFQEVGVPVTLTIDAGGAPIKKKATIDLIQPAEQKTVTFTKFDVPPSAFGNQAKVTVFVKPVPGEIFTSNNTATYTVFFTLS
jgi:hypothetical protein